MKKLTLGVLFGLSLMSVGYAQTSDSTATGGAPSVASAATAHQLFHSCKKGRALYGCEFTGKAINEAYHKAKDTSTVPVSADDNTYTVYWWPKSCTPSADLKTPNNCTFNVLAQAGAATAPAKSKKAK